jgi:choline dehydrogenase
MPRIFDYVIVGAGSAGCVLANRLSADPAIRVCLLEAGPEDRSLFIHVPIGLLWLMHSRTLNWRYFTEPQTHLAGRRLFWPRGRVLGGSSSSNAMCYTRGNPADYDQWRDLGNSGWGYEEVLPWFRRAEHQQRGPSPHHGVGGPLHVADQRSPNPLSHAFVRAAQEAGHIANEDFNGAAQEGVGLYQVTQVDGWRCSAARAYLAPVRARPNLTILTNARATRIVLRKHRAEGVECVLHGESMGSESIDESMESMGSESIDHFQRSQARSNQDQSTLTPLILTARREVILSAGAINSPQLLMLSGIGPVEELRRHGITPIVAAPDVGRNLQDHLDVIVVQACKRSLSYGFTAATPLRVLAAAARFAWSRRGMLTSNGAEAGGFARSRPQEPLPDLQFHFTPIRLANHGLDVKFLFGHGYSLHVCALRPRSRGRISLNSADPMAPPSIDPAYLSDPADLDTLLLGVKAARRILASPAFGDLRGSELSPGPAVQSDDEIRDFIRHKAETIYHPVGTCRMGSDQTAVVDNELRVHGIERLRVVDASIMPTLIAGNTNAPVIMIAEKAADLLLHTGPR